MFLLKSIILEINDNAKETEKNDIQIYQLNWSDEKEKRSGIVPILEEIDILFVSKE